MLSEKPGHENSSGFTFRKRERLTGEIRINNLYKEGKSFMAFPFFVVIKTNPLATNNRLLISVGKKRFKRAVDRNLMKRRIREAYRLNKLRIDGHNIEIALNYVANTHMESALLQQKMISAISKINHHIAQHDHIKVD